MSVYNTFAPFVVGRGSQATRAAVAQAISVPREALPHRLTSARIHAIPQRGAIHDLQGAQA